MHRSRLLAWLPVALLWATASAQSMQYVDDLQIFTSLAPCAAKAISYVVYSQTYSNCPQAVTELQSCVCTKQNNFASISSVISKSISYSCGSTATDDQASASTVMAAYCNPAAPAPAFPTPAIKVSQYLKDIPNMTYLPPCASSVLSSIVQSQTYSYCPPDAAGLAVCACNRNQNSLRISQSINTSVRSACDSLTVDVASAQAMFAAYCALNNGTSNFPVATSPPGQVSYYITDLPAFSSLAKCAQSGLSYGVFTNTRDNCNNGPRALASCVCLKEGMGPIVTNHITSSVKYYCSSTASEDVASALSVFNSWYCAAAKGEVNPTGVIASIAEPTPAGVTGGGGGGGGNNGPKPTGPDGKPIPGAAGGDGGNGTGNNNGANNGTSSGPSVGVIAGGVVGGVAVIAAIGIAAFFIMRNKRRQHQAAFVMPPPAGPHNEEGKPELDGANPMPPVAAAAAIPPPSPNPSMMKQGNSPRVDNVSPASAHNSMYPPPPNAHTPNNAHNNHFAPPPLPNGPELAGQMYHPGAQPSPGHSELQGHVYHPNQMMPPHHAELQGQGPGGYASPLPNHAELHSPMGGPSTASPAGSSAYATPYGPSPNTPQPYPQQMYGQPPAGPPGQGPVYQADSRPVPQHAELPGMGWQSGPVAHQYAELDSQQNPHAR